MIAQIRHSGFGGLKGHPGAPPRSPPPPPPPPAITAPALVMAQGTIPVRVPRSHVGFMGPIAGSSGTMAWIDPIDPNLPLEPIIKPTNKLVLVLLGLVVIGTAAYYFSR